MEYLTLLSKWFFSLTLCVLQMRKNNIFREGENHAYVINDIDNISKSKKVANVTNLPTTK